MYRSYLIDPSMTEFLAVMVVVAKHLARSHITYLITSEHTEIEVFMNKSILLQLFHYLVEGTQKQQSHRSDSASDPDNQNLCG